MSRPLLSTGHGARLRAPLALAPLALALVACAVHCSADAVAVLEYDRRRIAVGELWRLLTCQLTHCSLDHLLLDALVLALAGTVYQLRGGRRLLPCIALAALTVPAAIWLVMPQLASYRGLSGLDAAVTMLLAVSMLGHGVAARQRGDIVAAGLAVTGLLAKIAFELLTGQTAFVDSVADQFIPVPLAHLVGGLTGVTIALLPRRWSLSYPGLVAPGWARRQGQGQGTCLVDGGLHRRCALLGKGLDISHLDPDDPDLRRQVKTEQPAELEHRRQIKLVGGAEVQRQLPWWRPGRLELDLNDRARRQVGGNRVNDDQALMTGEQIKHCQARGPGLGQLDAGCQLLPAETVHHLQTNPVITSYRVAETEDQGHQPRRSSRCTVPSGASTRTAKGIRPGMVWVAQARQGS